MNASECFKVLLTSLESGVAFMKPNEHGGDDGSNCSSSHRNEEECEETTKEFVSILSSSVLERSTYLDAIRSVKFQKQHARRLFSALFPLLKYTFDNEHYVPISAFEEEEESTDDRDNDSIGNINDANDGHNDSGRHLGESDRKNRNKRFSEISECVVVPDPASTQALSFVKYSAMIVHAYLDNQTIRRKSHQIDNRVYDMMEEVYVVAEMLHDNLFALNSCGREGMTVQKVIIDMCEAYWKGQFSDREALVPQLMPLLVVKSLNGNATKADIKRLWNTKEALHLLDFQKKSTIVELRNLLLKTVTSALFLKNTEGRKMIAYLFQLDPSLVKDLHQCIRAQISFAVSTSTLEAYGEIYLTAWKTTNKDSETDFDLLNIESGVDKPIQRAIEDVLQELMFASLHAPTPQMAKAILTVLSVFNLQKKDTNILSLVYKLYNPILWRALSATNPLVRIHASTVLHTTFPLHDPSVGKSHLDEVHSKSMGVLKSLLTDDDPKVRIAGCNAAIRVLGTSWDTLRSEYIRSLLNIIIMKHANDSSSAAVRVQAIKGIALLLDAPASHAVLKPLLSLVGNHIHDSVEKVRLECVKLLLKVKGIKGIKYYHVVPSQHIMSRLAVEGITMQRPNGSVASAISELLLNSYFPKGAKGSDQINRTLSFIMQNRNASRVFYSNISSHLETNYISKLIVMLFKTIKISVEKAKRKSFMSKSNDDEAERVDEIKVEATNIDIMAGLSETLCIVWKSVRNELLEEENNECLRFVEDSISSVELAQLCEYFEKIRTKRGKSNDLDDEDHEKLESISSSLLFCASYCPSKSLVKFCAIVKRHIQSRKEVNMLPYYAALCSWDLHDEVAFSISNSIDHVFNEINGNKDEELILDSEIQDMPNSRGKRKHDSIVNRRPNKLKVPEIPSGKMSLTLISKMLSGKDLSCKKMRDMILSSEVASCAILTSLEKATTIADWMIVNNGKQYNDKDVEFVLDSCEVYSRFVLHKEALNVPLKLNSYAKEHFSWISTRVIKVLNQMEDNDSAIITSPFQDLNISRISAIGCRGSDIQPSLSPLHLSPPRCKSDMGRSSSIDKSFFSMEERGASEFVAHPDISPSIRTRTLGLSLIWSSMNILGEWLLAGVDNKDEIVQTVKSWCEIMDKKTKAVDANYELFPCLCRFMIISGRECHSFGILDKVLTLFDKINCHHTENEKMLAESIQHILLTRGVNSTTIVSNFMESFLESISVFMENADINDSEGIFDNKELGYSIVMQTIVDHGKTVPLFIQTLLKTITVCHSEEILSRYLQILQHSCKNCRGGKSSNAVKALLQHYLRDESRSKLSVLDQIRTFVEAVSP